MTKIWGLAVVICASCCALTVESVDCRRFVFAPICRGISAKRSQPRIDDISSNENDFSGRNDWIKWQKIALSPSLTSAASPMNSNGLTNHVLREIFENYRDYSKLKENEDN